MLWYLMNGLIRLILKIHSFRKLMHTHYREELFDIVCVGDLIGRPLLQEGKTGKRVGGNQSVMGALLKNPAGVKVYCFRVWRENLTHRF